MNKEMFLIMKNAPDFIEALDQSVGSTPKALKSYGIEEDKGYYMQIFDSAYIEKSENFPGKAEELDELKNICQMKM
ncbi:MAG: hypothetical protein SOR60_07060 [Anaerococcus porci]|nr:hypothetical protein [Anaerococcus porci]MDY3006739.1 hypothetical protein [Anaerococcus porci]